MNQSILKAMMLIGLEIFGLAICLLGPTGWLIGIVVILIGFSGLVGEFLSSKYPAK